MRPPAALTQATQRHDSEESEPCCGRRHQSTSAERLCSLNHHNPERACCSGVKSPGGGLRWPQQLGRAHPKPRRSLALWIAFLVAARQAMTVVAAAAAAASIDAAEVAVPAVSTGTAASAAPEVTAESVEFTAAGTAAKAAGPAAAAAASIGVGFDWEELIRFGIAAHRRGDLDGAREALARVVAKRPRDGRARALLGATLYAAGDFETAESHMVAAVRLRPTDHRLLSNLATMYVERGNETQVARGILILERAIAALTAGTAEMAARTDGKGAAAAAPTAAATVADAAAMAATAVAADELRANLRAARIAAKTEAVRAELRLLGAEFLAVGPAWQPPVAAAVESASADAAAAAAVVASAAGAAAPAATTTAAAFEAAAVAVGSHRYDLWGLCTGATYTHAGELALSEVLAVAAARRGAAGRRSAAADDEALTAAGLTLLRHCGTAAPSFAAAGHLLANALVQEASGPGPESDAARAALLREAREALQRTLPLLPLTDDAGVGAVPGDASRHFDIGAGRDADTDAVIVGGATEGAVGNGNAGGISGADGTHSGEGGGQNSGNSGADGGGGLRIVTVATELTDTLRALLGSAAALGHDLEVLGLGTAWGGLGQKVALMTEWLASLPEDDVVLFVDAYDVILLPPAADIVAMYRRLYAPAVVFGAETASSPDVAASLLYEQHLSNTATNPTAAAVAARTAAGPVADAATASHPGAATAAADTDKTDDRGSASGSLQFLNSGTYMGDAAAVRALLEEVAADIAGRHTAFGAKPLDLDDQRWFTRCFLRRQPGLLPDTAAVTTRAASVVADPRPAMGGGDQDGGPSAGGAEGGDAAGLPAPAVVLDTAGLLFHTMHGIDLRAFEIGPAAGRVVSRLMGTAPALLHGNGGGTDGFKAILAALARSKWPPRFDAAAAAAAVATATTTAATTAETAGAAETAVVDVAGALVDGIAALHPAAVPA